MVFSTGGILVVYPFSGLNIFRSQTCMIPSELLLHLFGCFWAALGILLVSPRYVLGLLGMLLGALGMLWSTRLERSDALGVFVDNHDNARFLFKIHAAHPV